MLRPSLIGLLASALVLACAHSKPAPSVAAPPPSPADPASVDRVLRASPEPDAQTWRDLGPGASALLSQAAQDGRRPAEERARAVRGLGAVDEPEASPALADLMANRKLPPDLRVAVVRALAGHDGRSAAGVLARGLSDPDPAVRSATAQAMGSLGGSAVRQSLEEQLDKETDAGVREVLLQSLSRAQP